MRGAIQPNWSRRTSIRYQTTPISEGRAQAAVIEASAAQVPRRRTRKLGGRTERGVVRVLLCVMQGRTVGIDGYPVLLSRRVALERPFVLLEADL